ncbi:MAG: hypothetical protein IRY83_15845 [Chloroflexi bacterium]|nr:hypothetical protein [Chloroflexota bacterium]
MPDRAWKRTERAIARHLGGQRRPVTGRGSQPDVAAPRLAIEGKHRKALPTRLTRALTQAAAGVVVLHAAGQPQPETV